MSQQHFDEFQIDYLSYMNVINETEFKAHLLAKYDVSKLDFESLDEMILSWNQEHLKPLIQLAEQESGIELGRGEDLHVIAPSPHHHHAGKVRVTFYKNGRTKGPINETHYSSFAEAIHSLHRTTNELEHCPGRLDDWMTDQRFINGFEIASLVEKYNSGEIPPAAFFREMERLAA